MVVKSHTHTHTHTHTSMHFYTFKHTLTHYHRHTFLRAFSNICIHHLLQPQPASLNSPTLSLSLSLGFPTCLFAQAVCFICALSHLQMGTHSWNYMSAHALFRNSVDPDKALDIYWSEIASKIASKIMSKIVSKICSKIVSKMCSKQLWLHNSSKPESPPSRRRLVAEHLLGSSSHGTVPGPCLRQQRPVEGVLHFLPPHFLSTLPLPTPSLQSTGSMQET